MSTEPTPLQFDNAEYGGGAAAPTGIACAACKRSIVDQYYEAVSKVFCGDCAAVIKAGPKGGSRLWRTIEALLLGTIGGVVGAVIWFLIWKFTGYQLGLIAILVGVLVGGGVRKGSRGRGGWFYQLMALGITYSAITATNIPPLIEAYDEKAVTEHETTVANAKKTAQVTLHRDGTMRIDDREVTTSDTEKEVIRLKEDGTTLLVYRDGRAEGEEPTDEVNSLYTHMEELKIPIAHFRDSKFQTPHYRDSKDISHSPMLLIVMLGLGFLIALAVPFLSLPQNFMGLIIIAIALYEAWKINKKPKIAIAGPFVISPGAMGQGSIVHVPPRSGSATALSDPFASPPVPGDPPQGPASP